MDDAYHYLQSRDLMGLTNTFRTFPQEIHSNDTANETWTVSQGSSSINPLQSHKSQALNWMKLLSTTSDEEETNRMKGTSHQEESNSASLSMALLVWSAPDENALHRVVRKHNDYLKGISSPVNSTLGRLAFTLAARRTHFLWRTFSVVDVDTTSPVTILSTSKPARTTQNPSIAFVFTGQGAQYVNMGLGLLKYPIFEATLRKIDNAFSKLGNQWSVFGKASSLMSRQNSDG